MSPFVQVRDVPFSKVEKSIASKVSWLSGPAGSTRYRRACSITLGWEQRGRTTTGEWSPEARAAAPEAEAPEPPPNRPPRARADAVLDVGGEAEVELSSAFSDPDGDRLAFAASSSDESVATARVADGELVVEPAFGAEGRVRIVVVATDASGQSVTQEFDVTVEFYWPPRQGAGWRGALRPE